MGLALGLTCSILIMLWVQDEYSMDAFHENNPRLYHVYERRFDDRKVQADYRTQALLAAELKANIPAIRYASSMETSYPVLCQAGDKILKTEGAFASSDFFKMFSYPLLAGTPHTSLNGTRDITISRHMAELLFGTVSNAMGKVIRYANKEDLAVTGVFENIPAKSSLQFDFVRPWEAFANENAWAKTWSSSNPLTMVQLNANADPAHVSAEIKNFLQRYIPGTAVSNIELDLQPYSEKYLHETFVNGFPAGGRIDYVKLFSIVAMIILLIACINFMNLSTAR